MTGYTLVSNSDAHSPAKLAREANLFDTDLSYPQIARALDKRSNEFLGTLEFFPEEGKYHYDGHRNCGVCQKPSETIAAAGICPVCGRRITVGVLHRVEELADREEGFVLPAAKRFESLVPLPEIIACSEGLSTASKKVEAQYFSALRSLGPELYVLRQAPLDDIARQAARSLPKASADCAAEKLKSTPVTTGNTVKLSFSGKVNSACSPPGCTRRQNRCNGSIISEVGGRRGRFRLEPE